MLPQGLCVGRRLLLSDEPAHLDRRLLPERTIAEWPQQEPMPSDLPYSDRAAMLQRRPDSDCQRRVLSAHECNDEWRMLSGPGRSQKPGTVPGHDRIPPCPCLRGGLRENAGRFLLQQPLCRRRWKVLQHRTAGVPTRPVPQQQWNMHADPDDDNNTLCARFGPRRQRQLQCATANPASLSARRTT